MVSTRRKRAVVGMASENANSDNRNEEVLEGNNEGNGGYEKLREQRIQENKERMQKLGFFDLLKSRSASTNRTPRNVSSQKKLPKPSLPLSDSPRRSSRLKSQTPVNYSELRHKAKKGSAKGIGVQLREGSKPEVYTEEHEKLLGDCKTAWTLFVDGYGTDGKRIYDPENGETCHQCRQKTLGRHTHCSECNVVQGQFCGDCLYMRYGENVIEVNENPNWVCPVCRGICNCSICRKAKGWVATGSLYRKVTGLGFKSVAHYLIQTRLSQIHSDNSEARELPLADKESHLVTDGAEENHDEDFDLQSNDDEVEMEEKEKLVYCSDSSKYIDIDDESDDIDDNSSSDNGNRQKEKTENMEGDDNNEMKEKQTKLAD
ncbi:hypothetical protein JCGZ_04902 [Jatropha curcas]|uniref:Zinc-finger domain-containing protein n=1 Tax=Jatropha curcas TaxID=180498 RepID=A0A067L2G2_JATCU|nr:cell division cycle-associated 7-like protein [Jatropha curcas]KDP38259.1 hypothetical protein JCGZ_04902 [Jatropha curcas]